MNWRYFLFAPIFIVATIYIGKYITSAPSAILVLGAALLIGLITLQNPENGLLVLVFSMLLSPQIIVTDIPGRPLTIRVDDFLIIAVFFAWIGHITLMKDWRGFVKTRLDLPIFLLLSIYIIGTTRGIIAGSVTNPLKAFFFTLKYVEYYILYWIAVNVITSKKVINNYLVAGLITMIIVALYAYSLFGQPGGVYAPFEWAGGEPASLGGYLLIVFAVLFAFMLHVQSSSQRYICLGLILFMLPPFVRTLSRASYLAFVPMLLTMLLLTKKRKTFLLAIILIGVTVLPLVLGGLYTGMVQRIQVTFNGSHTSQFNSYQVGGKEIKDQSALERIESWKWVLAHPFSKNILNMLIGTGVTGLGFVEGQFFLVLGESGVLGGIFFYWLLFRIIKQSYHTYRDSTEVIPQSLSLAAVCSLIAMLFQSLTTNTFIIVRIMEPFWFLIAMVTVLPNLSQEQETAAIATAVWDNG